MSETTSLKKGALSLAILFLGSALSALAGFITKIVIARNTSPEIFGNYSTILTTITTLAPLCGFGIAQYWLKVFGQHGAYGIIWVKQSLIFVSISTITIFCILMIWFMLTLDSNYLKIAALILTFIIFNNVGAELLNSTLQIEGKYTALSIWQLFQSSFLLITIGILLYIFKTPLSEFNISVSQSLVAVCVAIGIIPFITHFIRNRYKEINQSQLKLLQLEYSPNVFNIMKEAAPFGVAGLFYLIYYQFGVVFVRQILGPTEAGYYSVAFVFLSASLIIPGVIYQKFLLPKLHRWAYHDREKFIQSYVYGNYIMLGLGVIGLISLWILAPYIIPIFFGEEYNTAIPIVQTMAINIPIVYVASSAGSLLVTKNHMKTKVYYMGFTAILSLVISAPMILYFGVLGAVYTNIFSNLIICILYFRAVQKKVIYELN